MNPNDASGSRERERVDKGHLPRLAAEWYRGRAFVHWTPTIEHRATGWLTPEFHHAWQLILLHACARYELIAPAYVLMPDHVHLVWVGLSDSRSDQRIAIEFLRKNLRPRLAPADWQRQPHDNVLARIRPRARCISKRRTLRLRQPSQDRTCRTLAGFHLLGMLRARISRPRRSSRRLLGLALAHLQSAR